MPYSEPNTCLLCEKEQPLIPIKQHFLCTECLNEGNDWRLAKWESWFQRQISHYLHLCKRCLKTDDTEAVHQARVTGRKLASLLQFLNVPKNHPLVKAIKNIHALLNPVREADVFLNAFRERNQPVHKQLFKKIHKKRKKQQKKLQESMPKWIKEASRQFSAFSVEELPFYALSIDPDTQIQVFEERFSEKAEHYQQTADSYGKQAAQSVKALHKVRIQAKMLRYMYADLASLMGRDFSKKEKYYKNIQSQFGDINDVQDWLDKLKRYEEKLNVPKEEIASVRTKWQRRLNVLIEEVTIKPVKTRAG